MLTPFIPLLTLALCSHASLQATTPAVAGRVAIGVAAADVLPALTQTLATRAGEGALELDRVKQSLDGQLITAFGATAKFDVIARSDWPHLIREQDFVMSGNVSAMDPQAAKSFELSGIRWLIVPQIADFQDYIEAAHFEGLGQRLSRRLVKLGLVTKVYDTSTGRLVESVNSQTDEQQIVNDPTNSSVQGGRITDSMIFSIARTSAQQVALDVIDRLMPAQIVAITDRIATISRGAGGGIAPGQVWQVFARGKPLVDPDTGESLGSEEVAVGWLQVQTADGRTSRAALCGEDFGVASGCIVRRSNHTMCPATSESTPHTSATPLSVSPANATQGALVPVASPASVPAPASYPAPKSSTASGLRRPTAAIFVKNRSTEIAPEKVMVLEDYLSAEVDKLCFATVSREDTLNAVARFATAGANAGTQLDSSQELDRLLSDETSALRLAQQMGVDYIMIASITAYIKDTIDSQALGEKSSIRSAQMDVTYRVLGRAEGQVIMSDVVSAVERIRDSSTLHQTRDLIDLVIRRCANSVGESIAKRCNEPGLSQSGALLQPVDFRVRCTMQDMAIPGVVTDPATGRYIVSGVQWNLLPTTASVAIDGIVMGSAPDTIRVLPGLHKVLVAAEGFRQWERTVLVRDGMELAVALQLTDDALARWREQLRFVQGLTQQQQLTDADVDVLRSTAEFIRNSRVVLDVQNSTTVNTNQPPTYIIPGWWPSANAAVRP